MILHNIVPTVIIALLIILGLKKVPEKMIRGFKVFGDFIVAVITIALAAAIIESLTGITVIPGMAPLEEGFEIVGNIAIVLAGAFPMVYILTKKLKKPLQKLGTLIGINDAAAGGLVASMANNIPMCGMMKNMNNRGKIINAAFVVSGTFIFGDDLAFTASVDKSMILPMIVGKGTAGIAAVALAWFATREKKERESAGKTDACGDIA